MEFPAAALAVAVRLFARPPRTSARRRPRTKLARTVKAGLVRCTRPVARRGPAGARCPHRGHHPDQLAPRAADDLAQVCQRFGALPAAAPASGRGVRLVPHLLGAPPAFRARGPGRDPLERQAGGPARRSAGLGPGPGEEELRDSADRGQGRVSCCTKGPGSGQPTGPGEAEAAYCAFIGALLDMTDNIVDAKVVHPAGVVCRDGDDPYFVVAPDKGTGAFSDLPTA